MQTGQKKLSDMGGNEILCPVFNITNSLLSLSHMSLGTLETKLFKDIHYNPLWLSSLGQRVLDTCNRAGIYLKHVVVLQNKNSSFTLGGNYQTG